MRVLPLPGPLFCIPSLTLLYYLSHSPLSEAGDIETGEGVRQGGQGVRQGGRGVRQGTLRQEKE